jgi:hypothetical protein
MDVYGAFQLCSIGILVAPMTVRLSTTYFNSRGRNTIFLWAGLILAGKHCYPFNTGLGCLFAFQRSTAHEFPLACRTP